MANIITIITNKLKQILGSSPKQGEMSPHSNHALPQDDRMTVAISRFDTLNDDALVDLMERLDQTHEDMYSCEEAYALLDEYVELVTDDQDAVRLMPLVQTHLDHCPNCRDHYEILLNIIQGEAET